MRGGDDKASDNDKIAGADQPSVTPSPSTSSSGVSEEDKKEEAAAMDDAANFLRAIYR